MLVTDEFVRHALSAPQKTAVVMGNQRLSYSDLLMAARQVSAAIDNMPVDSVKERSRALTPSLIVGLLMNNCLEFLEIFLGTVMNGSLAMVMHPNWTPPKTCQVLSTWPPDIFLGDFGLLDKTIQGLAVELKTISIGQVSAQDTIRYAEWKRKNAGNWLNKENIAGDTPFYVGFTSGTTGEPKGFIRTHDSWATSFTASGVEFGTNSQDHILSPGPLSHSLTLYTAMEGLAAGATVYLSYKFNAQFVLDQIHQYNITVLVAVPTMLKSILRAANRHSSKFSSVRTLLSSGSKLDPALQAQLREVFPLATFFEFYGASELGFVSVSSSCEPAPAESVGRPFHSVKISIRQPDSRQESKAGDVGQLWVKSDLVCSGYLDSNDGTTFDTKDGWASVGDLAWRDTSGYIHLLGRSKTMLTSGGLNIYPLEIELVLKSFSEISDAVVFGLPDDRWGHLVCAVICWEGTKRLTFTQLRKRLTAQLERYKLPRKFFAADDLPHNLTGKIARAELRESILSRTTKIKQIR